MEHLQQRSEIRNTVLTAWFKRLNNPLRRWIRSKYPMSTSDTDDVVQEVFIRLLKYGSADVEHPQTYLFKIASNIVIENHERYRNCKPHDDKWLMDLPIESENEPEEETQEHTAALQLKQALNHLPVRQRNVFLLHHEDDLTILEAAQRLGITHRMAKRDLEHARSALKEDLKTATL